MLSKIENKICSYSFLLIIKLLLEAANMLKLTSLTNSKKLGLTKNNIKNKE